jgi:putative sterol carrier protein
MSTLVSTVEEYFATLPRRFQAQNAGGVEAIYQFELSGEGGGTYHVILKDGAMEIVKGAHAAPSVTLKMTGDDYVKMANGKLDGTQAFMTGKLKVGGQVPLAMKMKTIFPQGPLPG